MHGAIPLRRSGRTASRQKQLLMEQVERQRHGPPRPRQQAGVRRWLEAEVQPYERSLQEVVAMLAHQFKTLRLPMPRTVWRAVLCAAVKPCTFDAVQTVVESLVDTVFMYFVSQSDTRQWPAILDRLLLATCGHRGTRTRARFHLQVAWSDGFAVPVTATAGGGFPAACPAAPMAVYELLQAVKHTAHVAKQKAEPGSGQFSSLKVPAWVFDAASNYVTKVGDAVREAVVRQLHEGVQKVLGTITQGSVLQLAHCSPTAVALAVTDPGIEQLWPFGWRPEAVQWSPTGVLKTSLLGRCITAAALMAEDGDTVAWTLRSILEGSKYVCGLFPGTDRAPVQMQWDDLMQLVGDVFGVSKTTAHDRVTRRGQHAVVLTGAPRHTSSSTLAAAMPTTLLDAHRTIGRLLDMDASAASGATELLFAASHQTVKAVAVRTAVVARNAVQNAFKLAFSRRITMDALQTFMKTTRQALQSANPGFSSKRSLSPLRLSVNGQTAVNTALFLLVKCDTVLKLPNWPVNRVCFDNSTKFTEPLEVLKWMHLPPPAQPRSAGLPRVADFLHHRLEGLNGASAAMRQAMKAVKFARQRARGNTGGGTVVSGGADVTMQDVLVKEPLQTVVGPGWRRRVLSGNVADAMTVANEAGDADIWRVMVLEACELLPACVDEVGLAALALVLHAHILRALQPAPKVPIRALPSHRAVRHCVICGCNDSGHDDDPSDDDSDADDDSDDVPGSGSDVEAAAAPLVRTRARASGGAAALAAAAAAAAPRGGTSVRVIHLFSCAECTHGVCTDCRVEMVYAASRRALGLDPPNSSDVDGMPTAGYTICPVEGCGGTAPAPQPCPYMVLPPAVAAVAAQQIGKGPLPAGVATPDNAVRCAVCGAWAAVPPPEDGPVVTCGVCTMKTCVRCGLEAHFGVVCPSALPVTPTELLSLVKAQPCPGPGCGLLITKSGSCNHMHCPQCGIHWCWMCGRPTGRLQTHFYDAGHMDDEPVPDPETGAPPAPKCSMFVYNLAVECQRIRDALHKYLDVPTHRDAAQQALVLLQSKYSQADADL